MNMETEGESTPPDGEGLNKGIAGLAGMLVDGATIRCLDPNDMDQYRTALKNWGVIIRDLSAFEKFVPAALCRDVIDALTNEKSIRQLQNELPHFDGSLVKLGIYLLLHRGEAVCQQLGTHVLGPDHLIEAP